MNAISPCACLVEKNSSLFFFLVEVFLLKKNINKIRLLSENCIVKASMPHGRIMQRVDTFEDCSLLVIYIFFGSRLGKEKKIICLYKTTSHYLVCLLTFFSSSGIQSYNKSLVRDIRTNIEEYFFIVLLRRWQCWLFLYWIIFYYRWVDTFFLYLGLMRCWGGYLRIILW